MGWFGSFGNFGSEKCSFGPCFESSFASLQCLFGIVAVIAAENPGFGSFGVIELEGCFGSNSGSNSGLNSGLNSDRYFAYSKDLSNLNLLS